MKILILHQHFKTPLTGGAIRSYFLAKALVDNGHEAIVITGYNKAPYTQSSHEGINVHYLPVPYDNSYGFYARSWAFIRYATKSVSLVKKMKGIDLCYAISVPLTVGLAALWIKFRFGVPYIFEVGDLWPDAPIQLGLIRNSLLKKLLLTVERATYKNARAIVALSPGIQSAILAKHPPAPVHYIPNMADCDFYRPQEKPAELVRKLGVEGKFVVAYMGAIGFANGLEYLLQSAASCQTARLAVHFIVCGQGAMVNQLKTVAAGLKLENLSFLGFVNREGVKEVMNVTDAVFVCYRNHPILSTGSPNKYFDGLAGGKLIIINFEGWIKKEIEEMGCGVWVNPEDATDLPEKLKEFLDGGPALARCRQASRELAESRYDRVKLTNRWLEILG